MKRSLQLLSLRTSARFTSAALLLPVALLCGCGGSDHASLTPTANTPDNTSGPVVSTSRTFSNLEFTISTPKATYTQRESVPLTFTVKNIGTEGVNGVGGGCQALFSVSQGTKVIGPEEGICGAAGYTFALAPGETRTFQQSWNQNDANGGPVATGQYSLKSWITTGVINGTDVPKTDYSTSLASNPITISITN